MTKTVASVPKGATLVTGRKECETVERRCSGIAPWERFGVFVTVEEGEYGDVWAFKGHVPYNYKEVIQINE